jgi:hypothetical protein
LGMVPSASEREFEAMRAVIARLSASIGRKSLVEADQINKSAKGY